MSPLHLFTVFHANLDFSSLPVGDIPTVLDRCYWPLLDLAETARIPLGIEMPARTLQRLAREDPEWVKQLAALAAHGLVEVVGSGLAQVIGPLVPVDVNRANLAAGAQLYREILGTSPTTWFVNEQTFSAGIGPLYREVGALALVMEWNNPAGQRPELRRLRYRPAELQLEGTRTLPLLWNDCVVFQRLQRVAHGEVPLDDYLELFTRAAETPSALLLCAYGGDLEIFDYRPGRGRPSAGEARTEMGRVRDALRALAGDARFEFALPGVLRQQLPPGPAVSLASAVDPLPCKKQPRYNPTRWAVSGRDGFGKNTRCFELRRALRALRAVTGDADPDADKQLVALWRSDLRTRATEEKLESFETQLGAARSRAHVELERAAPELRCGDDVVLVNPWTEPWCGEPVEITLRLPPGRLHAARVEADPVRALPPGCYQLDVRNRHRDGSLARVTLVLTPSLPEHGTLRVRLVPEEPALAATFREITMGAATAGEVTPDEIMTASVEVRFLPHRGGALRELGFPEFGRAPLAGTIPHGTFDPIEYTPDFYSGHVVAHAEDGTKVTDLARAACTLGDTASPIRVSRSFRVSTPLGDWTTHYRVYRDLPRVDLIHELHLSEVRLRSLRLGAITCLPGAFERRDLRYETVNGGENVERFPLATDARIEQQRAVSPTVSATSCLGATEGWVSVGDRRRGLAVVGDRSRAAVVPLLEFDDVDDDFLFRIHHSAAECDDTSATFLRGTRTFSFALIGHAGDLAPVRRAAAAIERGLVVRTEQGVGLTRGI